MFSTDEMEEFVTGFVSTVKWLVFAGITGLIVGLIGVVFGKLMGLATGFRGNHDWVIFLLPVGAVAIIAIYRGLHVKTPRGTNLVLAAIHSQEEIPLKMAPLIFVSTVITHFVGGSAGREGAALQLGGSIGNFLGKIYGFDEKDRRVVVMCGMSAAFSALFGTPLAAAIFPLEVVSVGIMHYSALLPCVTASFVAKQVAVMFHMEAESFPVAVIPEIDFFSVGGILVLAIFCALISSVFCLMLHNSGALFKKISNPYIRALAGGCIILAVTLLLGTRDYMGAGVPIIERAIEGEVRPEAFLIKMILTSVTLACGYKGGEIVPSLFIGGTFGAFFGPIIRLPVALSGACGMAAVFCGVTNCPISTMLIAFEMFGFEGMPFYVIAVVVSYMVSGYYSLYHDQKLMYSKHKTEYVNRSPR